VDVAILVDATHREGPPGSLYVIEPSVEEETDGDDMPALMSPHDLQPANVLRALRRAGATVGRVVLVGCEPASFGTEDGEPGRIGLSDPVALAVNGAIELIEALLAQTACATTEDLRLATPVSRSVS
jgi:hydrogenase maturation protease